MLYLFEKGFANGMEKEECIVMQILIQSRDKRGIK